MCEKNNITMSHRFQVFSLTYRYSEELCIQERFEKRDNRQASCKRIILSLVQL